MHSVIRTLIGPPKPAPEVKKPSKVMESRIGSVSGYALYYLIDSADGTESIRVCEDPHGCDESEKLAEAWLRNHVPDLKLHPPQSTPVEGPILFTQTPAMI